MHRPILPLRHHFQLYEPLGSIHLPYRFPFRGTDVRDRGLQDMEGSTEGWRQKHWSHRRPL